jgi:queuosine precursor transporter
MSRARLFALLAICYVGLVVLANWLASRFTITVPLTGGLIAPAGVLCIGAVLVIRDWLQQLRGLAWGLALMLLAGAASYLAGIAFGWTALQRIALASVAAFLLSETLEAAVFTPIRKRSLTVGVALSATIANAVDSYVFLAIAFNSQAYFWGNFWGKLEMIAVGVALTAARRFWLPATQVAAVDHD